MDAVEAGASGAPADGRVCDAELAQLVEPKDSVLNGSEPGYGLIPAGLVEKRDR